MAVERAAEGRDGADFGGEVGVGGFRQLRQNNTSRILVNTTLVFVGPMGFVSSQCKIRRLAHNVGDLEDVSRAQNNNNNNNKKPQPEQKISLLLLSIVCG